MQIKNIKVFGENESIIASGYPFRVDLPHDFYSVNPSDFQRAKRLSLLDDGHDVFLQGIIVQFDLSCSVKMWQQLQRYHFVDFVSSQSTMHSISKMDFDKKNFVDFVDSRIVDLLREIRDDYVTNPTEENFLRLVYSLPVGFILTARLSTNLRQLKTIFKQRHKHRLEEWRSFCSWILAVFDKVGLAR